MRLKLIACEILYRELCAAIADAANQIDVEFMPKGLHDIGQEGMSRRLQEALAGVDAALYDAIVFGYGLCSNGLVGLCATQVPLVIPRAHDCITLFMGSKERYLEYFQSHPGVYYKTSGWIERGDQLEQLQGTSIQKKSGMTMSYDELVARYGEDNARFLQAELTSMLRNYSGYTYIAMGVGPDARFEQIAREQAAARGMSFERLPGDMRLIRSLLDGPWNEEDFLVVPPGHRVAPSFDERVIQSVPNAGD